MKQFTEVYIGRGSDNMFRIDIKCESSNTRIVEVMMSPEDFALAITGRPLNDIPARFGNLLVVGKSKVVENRSVVIERTSRDESERYLKEVYNPGDDWIVNPYLGSQKSIVWHNDGTQTLNFTVYKYI